MLRGRNLRFRSVHTSLRSPAAPSALALAMPPASLLQRDHALSRKPLAVGGECEPSAGDDCARGELRVHGRSIERSGAGAFDAGYASSGLAAGGSKHQPGSACIPGTHDTRLINDARVGALERSKECAECVEVFERSSSSRARAAERPSLSLKKPQRSSCGGGVRSGHGVRGDPPRFARMASSVASVDVFCACSIRSRLWSLGARLMAQFSRPPNSAPRSSPNLSTTARVG